MTPAKTEPRVMTGPYPPPRPLFIPASTREEDEPPWAIALVWRDPDEDRDVHLDELLRQLDGEVGEHRGAHGARGP